MTETTRQPESTAVRTVFVAFELGMAKWKLAVTTDRGERPRRYTVDAGDVGAVLERLGRAAAQWSLAAGTPVLGCYEAGRDGFWLQRCLATHGVRTVVIDPSSIERDRRAKAVKTDRVDAERLLELLRAWAEGRKRLRIVHVPSEADEDARQVDRELATLKGVCTALRNRITGLLVAQGVRVKVSERLEVKGLRRWNGEGLLPQLAARVARDLAELAAVTARIDAVEADREAAIAARATPAAQQMAQLMTLRGVGANGAARLVSEFFAWRTFRNGREVGALAGLTPTPYQSGDGYREQGISKAGNPRVRTMMVELAWGWLRFQPESALTRWFQARFGPGNRRHKRVGIVALARKLLVSFWRFLETGELPEGTVLKA